MSEIKLAGFELLQKVGQGGMGVVWKARQLSLDRIVAIKLLAPELNKNPDDVKRMMTEARTAARLKHPGIVQVYDASEEGGSFFFVMEYVDGYNVGQWVHRKKSLGWKDALVVAEYVAVALDYAWRSSGMIHCDVKPENIMVDRDGTIKVSDLGLSVTHETRADVPTEILGTPSYMSPEQVRGDPDLDCRTDIYSLGATLYQMITGRRLFQEVSDREAMECQLTKQVPDPQELVPGLPTAVASLLERMLVKDRAGRQKDWTAVITDLRRVQRGLMPAGKAPPEGASTVKRARVKMRRDPSGQADANSERKGFSWGVWALVALALAAAIYFGLPPLQAWLTSREPGVIGPPDAGPETADDSLLGRDQAKASFAAIERWVDANPDKYEEASVRYRRLMAQFPGTPEAAQALERVKQLREGREQSIIETWNDLESRAAVMAGERRFREAAHMLESYAGRWASETAAQRSDLARRLRQQDGQQQVDRIDEENWVAWLKSLGAPLALGKYALAQQALAEIRKENRFRSHAADIGALEQIVKGISAVDERVLQSFAAQTGTVVKVGLGRGELSVVIVGISGKKVRGRMLDGPAEILIGYDQLSVQERLARLGPADCPEVAIVKGVAAIGSGAYDAAARFFEGAGPLLSGPLLAKLEEFRKGSTDEKALAALAGLLKRAGATVGAYDEATWVAAANRCTPDRQNAAQLLSEIEAFLEKFGSTEFAAKATPVVLALQQVCGRTVEEGGDATPPPVTEAPQSAPVDMAVTETIDGEALRQALVARNPGLDAEAVTFEAVDGIEDARVRIASDWVRDLSPVAAMKGIKALHLRASGEGPVQLDARSLAGAGITELRLERYCIKDVTPLRSCRLTRLALPGSPLPSILSLEGMGLIELDISGAEVRDLNALRGMRLEQLDISHTKIASLGTLVGMPLRSLQAAGTLVRDTYPLRGMPLESLNLAQTPVFDFISLKGLRLLTLDLSGTKVHDLSFTVGMPLKTLVLRDTPIQDVAALKGRTLDRLDLGGSQVKDLLGLAGGNIKNLSLDNTKLTQRDVAQLQQVTMERLNLSGTAVSSLAFLEGKPLRALQIANTRVKDLGPLRGMPLIELDCQGTLVTDYGALRNMPIEDLRISGDLRDLRDVAGSLMNLRSVNGFDVRERIGIRPVGRVNAP